MLLRLMLSLMTTWLLFHLHLKHFKLLSAHISYSFLLPLRILCLSICLHICLTSSKMNSNNTNPYLSCTFALQLVALCLPVCPWPLFDSDSIHMPAPSLSRTSKLWLLLICDVPCHAPLNLMTTHLSWTAVSHLCLAPPLSCAFKSTLVLRWQLMLIDK